MDLETQALMTQIADEAANRAVGQTLLTLGIDHKDPIAVQKDMATLRELRDLIEDPEVQKDLLGLRKWRLAMDTMQSRGFLAALGLVCVGGAALILYAFRIKLFGMPPLV